MSRFFLSIALLMTTLIGQSSLAAEPALNVVEWDGAKQILVHAKQLVVEKGWQQAAPEKVDTVCVATALEQSWQKLGKSLVDFEYARDAMSKAIGMPREPIGASGDPISVPYWGRNLMYWNDATGRTEAQVLSAFDSAIKISEQQHELAVKKQVTGKALESFDRRAMSSLKLLR